MIRDVPLPPEWQSLTGRVNFVCKHSNHEYSSSCPRCGGDIHPDGEYPDRCRLFVDDHPTLYCRKCGLIAFPDQFGDARFGSPSKEQIETWRAKRIAEDEVRKRAIERNLAYLRTARIWERYHETMGRAGREYWLGRGVPESLQDFWRLGFVDEYMYHLHSEEYLSQSATIPVFSKGWQLENIKHRLLQPVDGAGRYRYELTGCPAPLFMTNPELDLTGCVYAIEGEIKAMVVWKVLSVDTIAVVGLPGANPSPYAIDALSKAERIVLVLDPGADEQMLALAEKLGAKRCRGLITPQKIDDSINELQPDKKALLYMLDSARPIHVKGG